MTGYGWAELQNDEVSLSVEIKGYNNRFLELSVHLPPFLSSLEPALRERIASNCARGSIEISIRYREHNAPLSAAVNMEAARAYYRAALRVAEELGLHEKPALAFIMEREGVIDVERGRDPGRAWERIFPVLEKAAAAFGAERKREGEHTRADIKAQLSSLEQSLGVVASLSSVLDEKLKSNVKTRFQELLGDGIDENRVLAETAALLVKYTISEEVSRLGAHLAEFRAVIDGDGGVVGKKLDFLGQEINREINTIGSKAVTLEAGREVVNMKNTLENIREQLRNVE
jgi:uncharacterized protein (TIGR00255 family)